MNEIARNITVNNVSQELENEQTIHTCFGKQVELTPSNIALSFQGREMTYFELNEKSNQLANKLRKRGVSPEDIIGIVIDRSFDMIIGILGVLKSGAAYLPIDPEYPKERIEYILSDSRTKLLITQEKKIDFLQEFGIELLLIDNNSLFEESSDNLENINQPSDLAYIIYTSGSTGNPKGVMIEHRNVLNTLLWRKNYHGFTEEDVILQVSSISFDSSVEEIFVPLFSGGKLIIIDQDKRLNMKYISKLIKENSVANFTLVPSLYRKFLQEFPEELKNLKFITSAGEPLTEDIVKMHYKLLPNVRLYNGYGPSESSISTSISRIYESDKINIGKPIANTKVYILDPEGNVVPTGVSGELCITGKGIARGYLNQPLKTKEKFLDNPFDEYSKLYKTGDLVRILSDGNMEFLGRVDNQVKIRGYRIELEEVENNLLKHENILEAGVIAKEDENHSKYLCGFLVIDKNMELSKIRKFLLEKVPDYMIPSRFIFLESLPLTPNGKIDRKKLQGMTLINEKNKNISSELNVLEDDVEKYLLKIWQRILNIADLNVFQSFFGLGGDSLKLSAILSEVEEKYKVEIPVKEFYLYPNIKWLADYIQSSINNEESNLEKTILEIWQQALNIDNLNVSQSFFELGGDSLRLSAILSEVEEKYEVEIPVKEFFEYPTVKWMANYIEYVK